MILARRLAVDEDAEADRFAGRAAQHEVKVAGMEAESDEAALLHAHSALRLDLPAAIQTPLVELQRGRQPVIASAVAETARGSERFGALRP